MPLTPATPASPASPARLRLPESSRIPMLPPKPDFAAVAEAATRTETNLLRWLDYTPEPTLEQLDVSSKVIWRLAAVRKTLSLVGLKKRPNTPVPRQLTQTMLELERLMAELGPPPPKPKPLRQPPNPFAPYPPYPAYPPLPPLSPLYPREQREVADKEPAAPGEADSGPDGVAGPDAAAPGPNAVAGSDPATGPGTVATAATPNDLPRPVPACPELHNPLHTVQAAERQVNQLCKDSGVPTVPAPDSMPPCSPSSPSSSSIPDQPDPTDLADQLGRPYPADPSDPEDVPDIRAIAAYVENLYQHVRAQIGPLPPMHPKAAEICPEVSHFVPSPFVLGPSKRPPPT